MVMQKERDPFAVARWAGRVSVSDPRPLPPRKGPPPDLHRLFAQEQDLPQTGSPVRQQRRPAGALDRRLLSTSRSPVRRGRRPGPPRPETTPRPDRALLSALSLVQGRDL